MGGWGSGGHNKIKAGNLELRRIDIRTWQREKRLFHGNSIVTSWTSRNGNDMGSINVYVYQDYITISYVIDKTQDVKDNVNLDYTDTNFGKRSWFICPKCGERVAVLYLRNSYFRCKTCQKVNYSTSQESGNKINELDRKIYKIQKKLETKFDPLSTYYIAKPKYMHYETYKKLIDRLRALGKERNYMCDKMLKSLEKRCLIAL